MAGGVHVVTAQEPVTERDRATPAFGRVGAKLSSLVVAGLLVTSGCSSDEAESSQGLSACGVENSSELPDVDLPVVLPSWEETVVVEFDSVEAASGTREGMTRVTDPLFDDLGLGSRVVSSADRTLFVDLQASPSTDAVCELVSQLRSLDGFVSALVVSVKAG